MKISNNALNFLLAQYRAIFKRAYVKGIASAVLLTAGLAAGQAQADGDLATTAQLPSDGQTAIITGQSQTDTAYDPNSQEAEFQFVVIGASGNGNWSGTLDVQSGSLGNNYIRAAGGALNLTGKTGVLNINLADSVADTALFQNGLSLSASGGNLTVDIKEANIVRGTLYLADTPDNSGSGSVTFEADTINIGTEGEQAYVYLGTGGSNTSVTLGRKADNQTGDIGSTITVGETGRLILNGAAGSGTKVFGDALNIKTGGVMLTQAGSTNTVESDNFTVENGAFKVISGSDTVVETFQGHTATVQSGGNFLVGQSGTWTIADTTNKTTDNKEITTQVTFEAGSNVQVNGQIVVSGGLLSIESGAGLYATAEGASGAGSIVVATRGTGTGLEIDSAVLDDFLTSGDTYNVITKDASGNHVVSGTASDKAGSILLSGGRLTFSDQDQVELSDFHFVSGTEASGGVIVVSGTNAVVGGHDISIAKALTKDGS